MLILSRAERAGNFSENVTKLTSEIEKLKRPRTPRTAILCVRSEIWCIHGRTALPVLASMAQICASGTPGLRLTEPLAAINQNDVTFQALKLEILTKLYIIRCQKRRLIHSEQNKTDLIEIVLKLKEIVMFLCTVQS